MKAIPRSRVITFRVTEEEHSRLKSSCDEGDGCLSEMARQAVLEARQGAPPKDRTRAAGSLMYELCRLDHKLDRILEMLSNQVGAVR